MKKTTLVLSSTIAILFVTVLYLLYLNLQNPMKPLVETQLPTVVPTKIVASTTVVIPTIQPSEAQAIPTSIPTKTPTINKAKLIDNSSWTENSCGSISFKAPATGYTVKCNQDTSTAYNVVITKAGDYLSSANILIKEFDGNSRRQYWINQLHASPSDVTKYMRFQETIFGKLSGLDVFTSGGWWQGGYSSPILISSGKTIVAILGGRDFNDQTGKITRSDFTDTIASTIKFNSISKIPSGWKTVFDNSGLFSVAYNPETQDINQDNNSTNLIYKNLTNSAYYSPYASTISFKVLPYDNGSRHSFIEKQMGEPLSNNNKAPGYYENNLTVDGKNCLVLNGISISQSPGIWGMCAISTTKALFFTAWNYSDINTHLATLKFL